MTAATIEDVEQDPNATPARQALSVAVGLAAIAQVGVEQRCRAWLAGRIGSTDLAYASATVVLRAAAQALLAGQHYAELEWATRLAPDLVRVGEQERLTRAMWNIVRDAEQARADDLAGHLHDPQDASPDQIGELLVMRTTRVTQAEVAQAGRTGYTKAVAQVVDHDPDYHWRFDASPDACARCVALAEQTFTTYVRAPKAGAHPGCTCTLHAELR